MKKKQILPLSHPSPVGKKTKNARNGFRFLGTVAFFFICLSTISVWRKRSLVNRHSSQLDFTALQIPKQNGHQHMPDQPISSVPNHESGHLAGNPPTGPAPALKADELTSEDQNHQEEHRAAPSSVEKETVQQPGDKDSEATSKSSPSDDTGMKSEKTVEKTVSEATVAAEEVNHPKSAEDPGSATKNDEPISFEELPDRIEWYTRDDFKEGTRPFCRISRPYILSNGTILLPDWMEEYGRLLKRCGLDDYGFYSPKDPMSYIAKDNHLDVDFVLTVHLTRFQEPTHDASVYLTEHMLKPSYLFDIFSGNAVVDEAIKEDHCYGYPNKSEVCEKPIRPPRTALKPGLFVPKRIETGPKTAWPYQMVDMFGTAYGHGHGATHLNVSSVLVASHAGHSHNLTGTRFRSILSMDGMFRHLPVDALKFSGIYSNKTGIDKTPKKFMRNGKCALTVGIIFLEDGQGIQGVSELQTKLDVLTKFAIPDSSIHIKVIKVNSLTPLSTHIREVQEVDILLGTSGHIMNSIGFMRPSSTVIELMPFGIQPNTHESMARALGMSYEGIKGKPQTQFFRKCIEGEIFNLRKKGKIKFTETPNWSDPLMKAWDTAVAEFTKSGSSQFNVLKAPVPIRNSHSRNCAAKQKVEVGLDDTARQVIHTTKAKCGSPEK